MSKAVGGRVRGGADLVDSCFSPCANRSVGAAVSLDGHHRQPPAHALAARRRRGARSHAGLSRPAHTHPGGWAGMTLAEESVVSE